MWAGQRGQGEGLRRTLARLPGRAGTDLVDRVVVVVVVGSDPSPPSPAIGQRAGASSAGGGGSWRSARRSPSTPAVCTWRRAQRGCGGASAGQEPPVNTGVGLAVQGGYCGAERQHNRCW